MGLEHPLSEDIQIEVDEAVRLGQFANAFRIMEDGNGESFLDFLVYSEREQKAHVVFRIRVRNSFIPCIRDRLSSALGEGPPSTKGIVH